MKDYRAFYEKHTAFVRRLKHPTKVLSVVDHVLTGCIGILFLLGAILAACGVFGTPLPILFAISLPPVCTVVAVTFLRIFIPRKRPYAKDGHNMDTICKRAGEDKSFPSRHTACAFVIGVSLCSVALWLGIPALVLGGLLAYVRFLCGFHFPTDLLAGGALGAAFGVMSFFL